MKKIIISTLFFLSIAGFASAQSVSVNKTSGNKHVSNSLHAKKSVSKKKTTPTAESDNRKEYVKDGQLATPTGHQATPVNSDQYQSPKDSSNKKKKKQ